MSNRVRPMSGSMRRAGGLGPLFELPATDSGQAGPAQPRRAVRAAPDHTPAPGVWPLEPSSPQDLRAILDLLQAHKGKDRAISSAILARKLQIPRRKVRALIAKLVDAGNLIGASVDGVDGGYFWIQTRQELEEARAILRARASKIFARDRALRQSWEREHGGVTLPLLPELVVGGAA